MTAIMIANSRLYQQHLSHHPFLTPAEVVASLGAVQAQDYLGAKWALGLRMQNATDAIVERALTEGTILRTHVMRPTWHFVAPADIRWLLELTASRVKTKLVTMDRRLELDKALLLRSYAVITDALRGGSQLTRVELGSALAQSGIVAKGLRLIHILMHAELDALICSGPRHGKQFTYMLLDERVPPARALNHDEALTELVRRFYTGHGLATVNDFVWWSGLTVADAKAGIAMLGSYLIPQVIDGQTCWFSASATPEAEPCQEAFLLPTFDEFIIGFAAFDQSRRGGLVASKNGIFDPSLVIGGQVVGSWRRSFKKGIVIVELAPFASLTSANAEAVQDAAYRYGKFLDMSVTLTGNS